MKKIHLNIEDLFNVPGIVIYEPDKLKSINYVSIDSRNIKKNTLFIAIKGNRFDGHNFIKTAIKNGAIAVIINKNRLNEFDSVKIPIITVKDTKLALGEIAGIWRKKLTTKIIGITGSSGKTTVKNMLASILAEKYQVNKTEANNNNHIGVPLTILNTNETHEVLVAELGTNHFGEIRYTASILAPDYSLITNIGDSHLEYLKTRNGVWREKSFLFEETIKNGGKVFLNYDDPIIKAKHSKKGNHISYGFSGRVDISGKIKSYTDDGKPCIELKRRGKKTEVTLPTYGKQSAKNFLASYAIAADLGLSVSEIKKAVKKLKASEGRFNVHRYKNFMLIDDTYNANPDSAKEAIKIVGSINTFKRKILILGDMLELGDKSIMLHKRLKNIIRESGITEVFTIGSLMKYLHENLSGVKLFANHFNNKKSLSDHVKNMDINDSIVLVKGSRGMHMEEVVSVIKTKAMN